MSNQLDDARRLTQARMLRWALLLDAGVYMDATLRWELGLGFVRLSWLGAASAMALVFWLFNRFFVRYAVMDLLRAPLTFLLWCWVFFVASTGNPYFDWWSLPTVDFFKVSLLDNWAEDGGFLTAGIAAAAHGVLAPSWRNAGRSRHDRTETRLRRGRGLALMIAASVALVPPVILRARIPGASHAPFFMDPRDPTQTRFITVEYLRYGLGLAVFVTGVWYLARGLTLGLNARKHP